jgi:hypothetical protein
VQFEVLERVLNHRFCGGAFISSRIVPLTALVVVGWQLVYWASIDGPTAELTTIHQCRTRPAEAATPTSIAATVTNANGRLVASATNPMRAGPRRRPA